VFVFQLFDACSTNTLVNKDLYIYIKLPMLKTMNSTTAVLNIKRIKCKQFSETIWSTQSLERQWHTSASD